MASKMGHVLDKIPFVGHCRQDKATEESRNAYFASLKTDATYMQSDPTVAGWIKGKAPTKQGTLQYITDTFPFLKWLFNYNLEWLMGDLIAGITVGAVLIPKGMAYAKLAQLPVQYGLYTSFIGSLCYWIFGTSKDITIGPVAVASIVTATLVADLEAENQKSHLAAPVLAGILAMFAGAVITLIGLLRLGWIVNLISVPAVSAFITGSAITVVLGQIPAMMGMRNINSHDAALRIGISIFKHLDRIRIDAAFGLSALAMLYGIKWTCTIFARRKPHLSKTMFFASSLRTVFVILLYTVISYGINHNRQQNPMIRVLGFIPRGFHRLEMPNIDGELLGAMLSEIPATVIVLLIEHISIGKEFGRLNNYTINPNSEFIAIGVSNIVGPFLGAYAATGSISGTAINSKAGCRTPLSGVFTALVVLIALYTLTGAFFFVPTSALAAVIIHAIGDLITPPSAVYKFWKISPLDAIIFVVGLVITIFNSIEHGIFATILLSLVVLLVRIFMSRGAFLGSLRMVTSSQKGQKPNCATGYKSETGLAGGCRNIYLPLDRSDGSNKHLNITIPRPGIFIYRFNEGLNYVNCAQQLDDLTAVITTATKRGKPLVFEKPGDRPWNVPKLAHIEDAPVDDRPNLKAIILDFSAVDNVDLTSMQSLADACNLLDRHAAPHVVQWHFACVFNPWTRRALAASGFGFPKFDGDEGPEDYVPIYSLAHGGPVEAHLAKRSSVRPRRGVERDIEGGDFVIDEDKKDSVVQELETTSNDELVKLDSVYGINRPFFHPDIQSAVDSAVAYMPISNNTKAGSSFDTDETTHQKKQ